MVQVSYSSMNGIANSSVRWIQGIELMWDLEKLHGHQFEARNWQALIGSKQPTAHKFMCNMLSRAADNLTTFQRIIPKPKKKKKLTKKIFNFRHLHKLSPDLKFSEKTRFGSSFALGVSAEDKIHVMMIIMVSLLRDWPARLRNFENR